MRNLIICLDGTWDGVHGEPDELTNIDFIAKAAAVTDEESRSYMGDQIVDYRDGIGVGSLLIDRCIMGFFGKGVFDQARKAWYHLRLNVRPDDKIFIFGFSRGAYAARQLASMIVHCGVRNTTYQLMEQDYRHWRTLAGTEVKEVKREVEFLGLFDCVPANQFIGTKRDKKKLNTPILERGINHFRHALARDERRLLFRPLIFEDAGHHASFSQLIFPGYHRDVGGGGRSNYGLATIPMWWIMREAYVLGMGFRMLTCQRGHREGNSTFAGNVNRTAGPVISDYPWTKYEPLLRHERLKNPYFAALQNAPHFDQMAECPKCHRYMFTPRTE